MIEFLEALLPFSSKLTQEARDLLSDELDRVCVCCELYWIECWTV